MVLTTTTRTNSIIQQHNFLAVEAGSQDATPVTGVPCLWPIEAAEERQRDGDMADR